MKSGERRFTGAAINAIYKQEAGLKVNSRFGGGGTTAAAGASTHFFLGSALAIVGMLIKVINRTNWRNRKHSS
jgi:hypothetical protein